MQLLEKIGRGENGCVFWARVNGKRRVVKRMKIRYVKVYVGLKVRANKKFPLMGVAMEHVTSISSGKDRETPYLFHYGHSSHDKDGARLLVLGNMFLTEREVASCLNYHVNPHLPFSTFCVQHDSWKTEAYYNISMDFAGVELDRLSNRIGLPDLQSIIVQVLVALDWAQYKCKFKHHDLHPGNLFIDRGSVPEIWQGTAGTYKIEGDLRCTIADFGLSAATNPVSMARHARVDYELNGVSTKGWGDWNHELHENEGYDLAVLFGCLKDDIESGECKKWVGKVLKELNALSDKKFTISKRGRPSGKVSCSPAKLLSSPLFKSFHYSAGSLSPQIDELS